MSESVGFIGLGIMGKGMALNLLRSGVDLIVWNRTDKRTDELLAAGARGANNPSDLASRCDIVITCVSDTPDVEEVILGEDGVLLGARPGTLVIDMSTISPHVTIEIANKLAEKEIHMLDAPISGGSEGAAEGTLTIMVGGKAKDLERALPYFSSMGKTITHVGSQGSGQMVKLVNQILVVGNTLAMSEALLFAQAGGLDLQKTLKAITGGAAGSWMLQNRGPQIIDRDWQPGFTIDLQLKDVRLAIAAADQLGVPLLATNLVAQLYQLLQVQGLGSEGNHALIKSLERLVGIDENASQ